MRALQPRGRVPPPGGPAVRFEALSHLLAASQGALTAPLFGEGTGRRGWRERRAGSRDARRWRRIHRGAGQRVERSRPDPKGDEQREGRDTRSRERGAERAMGEADARTEQREEGRGAPADPVPELPAPFPASLPPAAPAGTRVKQEPMSWKARALPHRSRLPLVGPAAGAGCCYDSSGWRWAGKRGALLLAVPSLSLSSLWRGPGASIDPQGPLIIPQGESHAPAAPGPKLLQKCPPIALPQPSPSSRANPTPPPSPGTKDPSIHPADSGEHPSPPRCGWFC